MRAPALLPLLAVALAGCLANPPATQPPGLDLSELSPMRFAILPPEEVWVPSSVDGERLNNAVYRPATGERVPVFVNFSPYWGDTALQEGDHFAQYMIHEYVPRGYAVVLSAVRGTGHSEGCFQVAGDLEVQDAYDVIDSFASQPWSSGAVGAGGKSYDSTTQNGLLAKRPHPALKTTFHVSGITDFYRYVYRNGVPYGNGGFNTNYFLAEGLSEYGIGGSRDPASLEDETPQSLARLADDLACPEFVRMTVSGYGSGAHGLKDAYWRERDWNRFIASSATNASIFFVHGLQDWNVKPDHILPWLTELPPGVPVKGWLHQWQRQPEGGHVYPMRTDWNQTMLRWLDHWLKGIDTGILAQPAFEVQGTDGVWRGEARWPPAGGPTKVPLTSPTGRADEVVRDVVVGTLLEAAHSPVRAAGVPSLRVTATSAQPDPVLTAVLFDIAPDGKRTWVNEAVLRGVLRNSLEAPSPVVPGRALDYRLEFYPMDAVLAPGHRWEVALGAAPRFVDPRPTQTVGVSYDLSSAMVEMPLTTAGRALAGQPEPMDCFAC